MTSSKNAPAPLLVPVGMWTLGMFLLRLWPVNSFYLILAAGLLGLAALLLPRLRVVLVILLFIVLGALRLAVSPPTDTALYNVLKTRKQIQQPIRFRVNQVFSVPENRYAVQLDSLATQPCSDKLIFYSAQTMQPGSSYRCLSTIYPLGSDPILDIYPSRYSAKAYQLGGIEELKDARILSLISRLRYYLMQSLDAKLGNNSAWAKGLLLSDSGAKRQWMDELSGSGIIHLIVVSGLHVWFIYLVVVSILRIFFSRRQAELIFLPLVLLFAALNNWAPPISRAIIMISIGIIAHWMQRPISGAQSLALALFIITLIDPNQLFSIGLQLSFVAVAVIIWGLPCFYLFHPEKLISSPLHKGIDTIKDGVVYSVAISLAITPLTLYYFGRASFNGIIGNVLGIPLIGILLPVSFLVMITPHSWYLERIFSLVYHAASALWEHWMQFANRLPFSIRDSYYSLTHSLALGLAILWCFLLLRGKFRTALLAFLPMGLIASALLFIPNAKLHTSEMYIFNGGVADCSLVCFANGRTLMVDTGGVKGFNTAENTIGSEDLFQDSWMQNRLLPWLGKKGINRIDYLVLTHLHADHCGGLLDLLKNKKVGHIFISRATYTDSLWGYFNSKPYAQKVSVHVIADTCSFYLNENKLHFLHPDKRFVATNENNRSLVCRLDTAGVRILFAADIEEPVEEYLVENYAWQLKCDFLKVPHHGSNSSSSEAFIKAAQPTEAWITVSARNRFGFPKQQVLQRYQKHNVRLESTAEGTLRKKIDISAIR